MQLGLTIPLQRYLKIKNLAASSEQPVNNFCWDLHIISLREQKSLLAVHCLSRYTFTLFGLGESDWQHLSKTFLYGLRKTLAAEKFSETVINAYLEQAGQIKLTKTHGRREVAYLNRAWADVLAADFAVDSTQKQQPFLDDGVNRLPCRCAGYEGVATSLERLWSDLQDGKKALPKGW